MSVQPGSAPGAAHHADARVRIADVALRDGLQNEPAIVPTDRKVELFSALAATGVDEIELTSLVRPDLVPQLADAEALIRAVAPVWAALPHPRPVVSALVPNRRGLDRLLQIQREIADSGGVPPISRIAVFTAASETFSRRNTNSSIAESLERIAEVIGVARDSGLQVRGYVSCAIACPYEGPIDPGAAADVARALRTLGADDIDLGDTVGAATPATTVAMLGRVRDAIAGGGEQSGGAIACMTLHLHQPSGPLGEIIDAAVGFGIRSFDASAGGLGGCPFASTPQRRAPGNIATAELVMHLRRLGLRPGTQDAALLGAADAASACAALRAAAQPGDHT